MDNFSAFTNGSVHAYIWPQFIVITPSTRTVVGNYFGSHLLLNPIYPDLSINPTEPRLLVSQLQAAGGVALTGRQVSAACSLLGSSEWCGSVQRILGFFRRNWRCDGANWSEQRKELYSCTSVRTWRTEGSSVPGASGHVQLTVG